MTKRLLIVVALLLLAAGCGREASIVPDLTVGIPTPAAATTTPPPQASPGATDAGAASPTPTPRGAPTAVATTAPPAQAPKPAAQGGVNTPKDGRYVYTYTGEATDPFNPAGGRQKFSGELTQEISHEGNVYTTEQTNSERPGRFTTRTRWEPSRILLLSYKTETPAGDFSCTLDPPVAIVKIPIRPETFPTQSLKGSGNACDGKIDITVEGQETVKDATGRSWSTWRVRVRLQVGNDQFTNTSDQKQWFSPELGVEVRSSGSSRGEVRTPGGPQRFEETSQTALKSHP